jgi:RNA polymerase sigma-70 factor (ECF subfamily)
VSQEGVQDWIRAGDLRRAAASLVVLHGSDVLATCIAMVRDHAVAEDLTQDVFSDAFRSLSTFRGESSPRTWLLSIARNRCVDYLRARKRDPWGGALDESSPDPDEHADEAALGSEWFADRSVVLRALDALAEAERALIVLRFKNGLEYDELAEVFGLREGTVRMRVSRALAHMRQVLETDAQAPAAFAAPVVPPSLPRAPMSPAAMGPPAPAAMRARAVLGGAPTGGRGGYGGVPLSWWERLRVWAGLGLSGGRASGAPQVAHGGSLGAALEAYGTAVLSEALSARLGTLVENFDRR